MKYTKSIIGKIPTLMIEVYDLEKGKYDEVILEQIKALAKIVSEDKLSPLDLRIGIRKRGVYE